MQALLQYILIIEATVMCWTYQFILTLTTLVETL